MSATSTLRPRAELVFSMPLAAKPTLLATKKLNPSSNNSVVASNEVAKGASLRPPKNSDTPFMIEL